MSQVYLETEHQELFVPGADLTAPVPVHVPSALGQLGYYVCLRVPASRAAELSHLRVRLEVGGLRPDDVTLSWGNGLGGLDPVAASSAPGAAWVFAGRAPLSRGDGRVTFAGLPPGLDRADLLLTTWPRFVLSGQADDWLACQGDLQWASGGIPLGGIGTGKVELCRDGRFRNFSANNNQDMPFEEPDGLAGAHLSVAAEGRERVLATRPASGLPPVPQLRAAPAFPAIALTAPEALPALAVEVEATGPLVPHDLQVSCLPGFLVRWTVSDSSGRERQVTCRLAWPNLVGHGGGIGTEETRIGYGDGYYRCWEAPEGHAAERLDGDGFAALRYGNAPSGVSPAADGHHYAAVRLSEGAVPGAALVDADPRRGSVAVRLRVPAGGQARAEMAVVWEMPHWVDTNGRDQGHCWQNQCRDGLEVLGRFFAASARIWREARALRDLLAGTDLPEWMAARLQNCRYPLVTNSALLRDGRFSINEGPTEMAGCYGTLDQRLAAHPATLLFYPELNRRELAQFAACQSPNGGVNHDLGGGHLDRGAAEVAWPDLTCSFILQLARHGQVLGDHAFAAAHWPGAVAALRRHRQWAEAGGGVAQVGRGLGTSYDGYHYEGTTPYMATLWIAALLVAADWARRAGDRETEELAAQLLPAARRRLEADLWNGRYYRTCGSAAGPANERCHAGLLAGEVYARLLAGESAVPEDRWRPCLEALATLNGSSAFAIPPDEVSADRTSFTEYGWLPYVEAFGLTALAIHQDRRVLAVWERVARAMDGGGAHPCDTRLMYQPLSGRPSWGSYYMTAPASWLVYEALLDFTYRPGDAVLRLHPLLEGRLAVVHPLFWGTAHHGDGETRLVVSRRFGAGPLLVTELETPAEVSLVRIAGAPLARVAETGAYARWALRQPAELSPGAVLAWHCD
ncbi:MAG: GH116 family glycosyl hydrolase [Gemmatimonadota bacterium]